MSDSGTGKKRGLDSNGGNETGNGPGQSLYTVCAIHFSKPLSQSFIVSEYLPHCHYVTRLLLHSDNDLVIIVTNCIQGNFDKMLIILNFLNVLKN